jgi:Holliday junction resolvasome RuvABC endonuclease subunit
MKKILALDLATQTGWAYRANGQLISGVQDFGLSRGESVGMRYIKFVGWLMRTIAMIDIDLIYYEQAHQRGGAATEVCHGFVTHLQSFCADKKLDQTPIHSQTLKKFTTGNGRANKEDMVRAINSKIDYHRIIEDHNEADAIALLLYAEHELGIAAEKLS